MYFSVGKRSSVNYTTNTIETVLTTKGIKTTNEILDNRTNNISSAKKTNNLDDVHTNGKISLGKLLKTDDENINISSSKPKTTKRVNLSQTDRYLWIKRWKQERKNYEQHSLTALVKYNKPRIEENYNYNYAPENKITPNGYISKIFIPAIQSNIEEPIQDNENATNIKNAPFITPIPIRDNYNASKHTILKVLEPNTQFQTSNKFFIQKKKEINSHFIKRNDHSKSSIGLRNFEPQKEIEPRIIRKKSLPLIKKRLDELKQGSPFRNFHPFLNIRDNISTNRGYESVKNWNHSQRKLFSISCTNQKPKDEYVKRILFRQSATNTPLTLNFSTENHHHHQSGIKTEREKLNESKREDRFIKRRVFEETDEPRKKSSDISHEIPKYIQDYQKSLAKLHPEMFSFGENFDNRVTELQKNIQNLK